MTDTNLLIPCEVCGRMVSRAASSCPQCGHPAGAASSTLDVDSNGVERVGDSRTVGAGSTEETGDSTFAGYGWSLALGVASLMLGALLGLLTYATVIVAGISLFSGPRPHRRRWMAWVGLALGSVYMIVNAYNFGHLDQLFGSPVALPTATMAATSSESPQVSPNRTTTSRSPTSTMTSTTPRQTSTGSSYQSIRDLRDAMGLAGYRCEIRGYGTNRGSARERAQCGDVALAIFDDASRTQEGLDILKEVQVEFFGMPITVRYGPNWLVNCGSAGLEICAGLAAMGGELDVSIPDDA